jgi:hypothetical protein
MIVIIKHWLGSQEKEEEGKETDNARFFGLVTVVCLYSLGVPAIVYVVCKEQDDKEFQ